MDCQIYPSLCSVSSNGPNNPIQSCQHPRLSGPQLNGVIQIYSLPPVLSLVYIDFTELGRMFIRLFRVSEVIRMLTDPHVHKKSPTDESSWLLSTDVWVSVAVSLWFWCQY